jgi:hypothetical protein
VGLNKIDAPDARAKLIASVAALGSKQLKALLETKHLYQRVSFEPKEDIEQIKGWVATSSAHAFSVVLMELHTGSHLPVMRSSSTGLGKYERYLAATLPRIKELNSRC